MTAPTLDAILAELLAATEASRTTLRLDDTARGWTVSDVAAEAVNIGVASLRGRTSIDQRATETVRWLERHRRLLVQADVGGARVRPPAALIDLYGVRAQLLAPILIDGELAGWVSIHDTRGPRHWTQGDRRAARTAVARIRTHLGATPARAGQRGGRDASE